MKQDAIKLAIEALEIGAVTGSLFERSEMIDKALRALRSMGDVVVVKREPITGKNYEAGDWSRRNWQAALEDQLAGDANDE